METIKLKTLVGEQFQNVAKKAKDIALKDNVVVEFDFNDVRCLVNEKTDLDHLWRDYSNAHLMNWGTVGPTCFKVYPPTMQSAIDAKKKESAEKQRLEHEAYLKKTEKEKAEFAELISGEVFETVDEVKYVEWKDKNKDPYGAVIFEYAEKWGMRLQVEISKGRTDKMMLDDFGLQPDYLGITGFQHGAAKKILEECWKHWNKLEQ